MGTNKRVVCISRTLAAGGESIGRLVATRLGFRYVDDEIVVTAAHKVNVNPKLVEQAEHKHAILDRVLGWLGRSADIPTPGAIAGEHGPPSFVPEDFRALIRAVVYETGRKGDVVILAHAASMALGFKEDVLRVLVTASPETRVKRLSKRGRMSEKEALKALKDSEEARKDYIKRFYQIEEELPTHYDLLLNTDTLTTEQAAHNIVSAARGSDQD